MNLDTTNKIKFGIWGIVFGAAVVMIVGFAWGGWETADAAEQIAAQAVLDSQAEICVAQFKSQSNYSTSLADFEKLDDWKKSDFIQKGGWAKMPGQEKAASNVCQSCANRISRLINAKK